MVWPYHWLTWTLNELGQTEEAERVARESIAIARQVGDRGLVGWANGGLSDALRASGRFAETQPLLEEYLTYGRESGDSGAEAWGGWTLGLSAKHLGSYQEARAAVQAALTQGQESGLPGRVAQCHMELGRLALAEGVYSTAQQRLQQSTAIYREIGGMYWIEGQAFAAGAYAARGLGRLAQARRQLDAALRIAVETHGHSTALHSLPAMALLLMDGSERFTPDVERAVELYALASRYPFVANSRWFEDIAGREIAAAAASTLSPQVIAAAEERGRGRDLWLTVEELRVELARHSHASKRDRPQGVPGAETSHALGDLRYP
jgi:tetratricopeptide (TPR) repeat protein